jgi:RNA polymerase sigma factor (sigma-70 family)
MRFRCRAHRHAYHLDVRSREGTDPDVDIPTLVERAREHDEDAWRALCQRVKNVAWKVIVNEGLRGADADDAFASTFLRLAEKLHTIREPEKLPGWLATTALNECRAIGRSRRRLEPFADVPEAPHTAAGPDEPVLELELRGAVGHAFAELSEQCQRLLRLLTVVPPLSYTEIGAALGGLPVGSIGPTRGRCLDRLRDLLAKRGLGVS